jgi:deoxyribose-phosphate aldolase
MSPNLEFKRNTAVGLDLGWINHLKVNRNAADRPDHPRR